MRRASEEAHRGVRDERARARGVVRWRRLRRCFIFLFAPFFRPVPSFPRHFVSPRRPHQRAIDRSRHLSPARDAEARARARDRDPDVRAIARARPRPPPARRVRRGDTAAFYLTLVPIRPRRRGERRSLRTLPVVSLRPPLAFNTHPRRLSTSTDAFELHPDVRSYRTARSRRSSRGGGRKLARPRAAATGARARTRGFCARARAGTRARTRGCGARGTRGGISRGWRANTGGRAARFDRGCGCSTAAAAGSVDAVRLVPIRPRSRCERRFLRTRRRDAHQRVPS